MSGTGATSPSLTRFYLDVSDDTGRLNELWPRCSIPGCGKILRGPVILVGHRIYHERCWDSRALNHGIAVEGEARR